jgi:predicted nucleic acid-binding protein
MKPVFGNSFYCLALVDKNDSVHGRAVELARAMRPPVITTACVITEIADALADSSQRGNFLALLASLKADPGVTIVGPDKKLYDAGLNLYARRPDKDWSLTDCISFVVMQDEVLTEALTGDTHFQQAGFQALLA